MLHDEVKSREDLVQFLAEMSSGAESFDNRDLGVFLEAASVWLADMDGYFLNRGEVVPEDADWSLFALILTAATAYE